MFRLLIGTIKVLKAIGAGLARVIQMCTNAFKRIRDAAIMARTALQNFLKALAKVPGIGKLVQITSGGITKKLKQQTFATKLAAAAMRGLGTAAVIGIPLLGAFGGQLGLIIALVWSLVAGLSAEQWAQIKSTAARVANVTATIAQTAAQWLLIVPLKVATGVMTIQAAKTFYLTGLTKVWTAVTKGAAAVQAFYSKALAATTAWLKRQGILAIWNAVATKASTLATKLLITAKIQLAGALAATTAWLQRQGVLTTWNLVVTKATTLATTVLTAAKTRLVGALAAGVIGWKALNVQQLINKVRTWLSVAATTALTVAKTHLVGAIAGAVIGWKALNVQQLIHKVRTWLSVAATTALTAVTKYAALTQLFFAHGMKVAGVWALALKAKLIGVKIATLSLQIAARATFIGWVPFLAGAAKALLVVGGALKVVMFGVIGVAKAIAATGIGAIVIGVGLLILLFVKLEKRFGLLGKLFKWFGKLGKIVAAPFIELWNWGKKVGPGLFSAIGEGIRRSVNLILTPMRWAFGLVKRLLPQSDALEGPFSQLTAAGRSIPETIGKGIRQAGPEPITEPIRQTLGPSPVSAVVQQLTAPAAAAVTTAAPPATAPAPAAGGITVGTIVINAESGDPAAIEAAVMEALAKADRQQRAQDRAALHDFASL